MLKGERTYRMDGISRVYRAMRGRAKGKEGVGSGPSKGRSGMLDSSWDPWFSPPVLGRLRGRFGKLVKGPGPGSRWVNGGRDIGILVLVHPLCLGRTGVTQR